MQEEKETTTVQNKMQLAVLLRNPSTRTHLANQLIVLKAMGRYAKNKNVELAEHTLQCLV